MSLADRIRAAVRPAHDAVEKTPFAEAMGGGRITRPEYVVGLRELAALHAALEGCLADAVARSQELAAVYAPATMARTPLLDRDLAAFGADRGDAPPSAATARLADKFRRWAADTPWALVGPLYITEGSRMGSMLLARSLSKAFGLSPTTGVGLDYHVEGMATRPHDWKRFRDAVGALPLSEAQQEQVLAAAVETMDGLVELYAALPVGAAVAV